MPKDIIDKLSLTIGYIKEETAYQKFFKKILKKYKVDSPADLKDAEKKKFFAEIEKTWTKEKGHKD